jgi:NhaA family Na+:H+ antiporter
MATVIAFAGGVQSVFGRRVPLALKVFLLALAIADDLGAVLVIAIFYTHKIYPVYLFSAAAVFGLMLLIRRLGVRAYLAYIPFGALAWLCFLLSGVHATIAGVVLGLLTPLRLSDGSSPLHFLVKRLNPYVNFLIMPVFALANAGVRWQGQDLLNVVSHPVSLGIALGLFLGKPIGIVLFSLAGVIAKIAELPRGVRWGQLTGVALLGGIGFTMALFIAGLALPEGLESYAKVGILGGSLLAAAAGGAVLALTLKRPEH